MPILQLIESGLWAHTGIMADKKILSAPLLAFALASCVTTSDPSANAEVASTPRPMLAEEGGTDPATDLAFAQAACGGCHAVEPPGLSPNPQSPTFADIANSPGLTDDTLATWLSDAHNYPEEMDFDLNEKQVATIARHMLRLRDPDYEKSVY